MLKQTAALAAVLLLVGCGTTKAPPAKTDIAAVEIALTAAEKAATLYVTRPQCPQAAPLCSERATVDKIKAADNTAFTAVRLARTGGDILAASSAIAALVALVPVSQ